MSFARRFRGCSPPGVWQPRAREQVDPRVAAGAASFAGMKAWEGHQRKEGMYSTTMLLPGLPALTNNRQVS